VRYHPPQRWRARNSGHLPGEIAGVLYGFAVDRGEDVAGLYPSFCGRAIRLKLSNEGSFWILQSDCFRHRRSDILNLHPDPTSRDMALFFQLLNNEFYGFRRNIKSDSDGPSRRRKYRCIDPNHFPPDVKAGSSRVPFVHRRVDLYEIFIGTCADIASAS
jgi:hypothetical protein